LLCLCVDSWAMRQQDAAAKYQYDLYIH